jgi:hypothetical protein
MLAAQGLKAVMGTAARFDWRRCHIQLLKHFQNTLYPDSETPLDTIPTNSIGGWGGWPYAVGSSMTLQNSIGQSITTYCILDSDYHTEEEIAERRSEAKLKNVQLHIWSRKEVENYLLNPATIHRLVAASLRPNRTPPSIDEIASELDALSVKLHDEINDALASEYLARNRAGGITKANRYARERLKKYWTSREGRLSIAPGKTLISSLSQWTQAKCGVSLNSAKLARELLPREIPQEIHDVIGAIERAKPFSKETCK